MLRRAQADEAEEVALLWLAARRAAVPRIPPPVHTDAEVMEWFASSVFASDQEVWVIDHAGAIVAMLVTDGPWIEQLYVHPAWTGQGLGTCLVDLAKARQPCLRLWTFQSNAGARRFYERHGFAAREETDGDNEEGAPDVCYEWSPP